MAAIDFPANPLDGDTCVRAGKTWTYSSAKTRWSAEATAASGGTWGSITGTLSSQTDLQTALNAKQATLVSGTNIKTVNGSTLLGSGNLTISSDLSSGPVTSIGGVSSIADAALSIAKTSGLQTALDGKSPLAGSSSITTLGTIATGVWQGTAIGDSYISSAATWNAKQAALVSGTNIKTVGGQSILGSGNLSVATIGAAATSHTHVSADITDATSAATADTVVKRGSSGEASFASNSAPTTALSASNTAGGRGATATSSGSGSGAYGSSATGAGLEGYSSTGVGILATSNSGTNHAEFGATSDNRSFVQRVSGLFGWWRGAYKQTLGAAAALTADRAVLLPDADIDFTTGLPVANGGTGATTASTARTNLGAGTTGSSLFTAATASAARTTLELEETYLSAPSDSATRGNNTLADDSVLAGVSLAANSRYHIRCFAIFTCATTAGIACRLALSAALSAESSQYYGFETQAGALQLYNIVQSTGLGQTVNRPSATVSALPFYFDICINTTAAITLSLQWAQNTTDAGNPATRKGGSWISVKKLNR